MPEVIGQDESVTKKKTCHGCGAILLYYPNEVKEKTIQDYSGCSDTVKWIVCPKCNHDVYV